MAYFLGINNLGCLKPIKVRDNDGTTIPNSILSLVEFTSSFENLSELLKYLRATGAILDDDYDENIELVYLIDKGQKGSKTYNVVPGTNGVILRDNKNNFNRSTIRKRLHARAFNQDFIEHLYAFYIRKFGVYNGALNRFKQLGSEPSELRRVITSLLKYYHEPKTKAYLYRILDILNASMFKGGRAFFESVEAREYFRLLDSATDFFSLSDKEVIIFSRMFFSEVKNSSIGALTHLSEVYRIVTNINNNGYTTRPSSGDESDLDYHIDSFMDFVIYNYDKNSKQFKTINGKRKLQERNLFDLGVFLSNYDEYELRLYQSLISSSNEQDLNDGYEEFLEEEDFLRINTTSEEQGIKLRITDGMRYSGSWGV